ncbi:MAG: radical SAM protein [Candidatus Methanomethylicaceae archaeon]|jgi:hypothetical protein
MIRFPFKDNLYKAVVKLPQLYNAYDALFGYYLWFRLDRRVTGVMGPKYRTNKRIVQVDITYDCNLRCPACCRSCSQAPSKDYMSVGQIDHFIQDSIRMQKKWQYIKLMGGEPTLHPDFMEILDIVRDYRDEHSPHTVIGVLTNRSKNRIREIFGKTYDDVDYVTSQKDIDYIKSKYHPFNLAPVDFPRLGRMDYSNGCINPQNCGLGLNRYGFYICGNGGGIDRIFGLDIGRKSIPRSDDQMRDQMQLLCRYCGEFHNCFTKIGTGMLNKFACSKSWNEAYNKYRQQKPALTLYQ